MTAKNKFQGIDIPIEKLTPYRERQINFDKSRCFKKIEATIKSIGLIEPLAVFQENEGYTILDGYLRYVACKRLSVKTMPCIIHECKEAYTYNFEVNRLSAFQEMKMLRKAVKAVNEKTIAEVFGMKTIHHRLSPTLLENLDKKIIKLFKNEEISLGVVKELAFVKPERQLEIIKQIKLKNDYRRSFVRTLILKTPRELRNPKKEMRKQWTKDSERKKELIDKLREAEEHHDFYTKLYRQYSNDLVKMICFLRKVITNSNIETYVRKNQPEALKTIQSIIFG